MPPHPHRRSRSTPPLTGENPCPPIFTWAGFPNDIEARLQLSTPVAANARGSSRYSSSSSSTMRRVLLAPALSQDARGLPRYTELSLQRALEEPKALAQNSASSSHTMQRVTEEPESMDGASEFWMERSSREESIYIPGDCLTVMMKNIPCACSRQDVLDAIASVGFEDLYDFFYLPIRSHKENVGYAFVGFPDASLTQRFADAMNGYQFSARRSQKIVSIAPAKIQGLNANREHFQTTRSMKGKWSPIFACDPMSGHHPGQLC